MALTVVSSSSRGWTSETSSVMRVLGAACFAVEGHEGDDRAVGHGITAAIVHRRGFDEDAVLRRLRPKAEVAGIRGDLLHYAPHRCRADGGDELRGASFLCRIERGVR